MFYLHHAIDDVGPPKGRNRSKTSSIVGDCSSTWAIDGGRPRFKLLAYALDAAADAAGVEGDEEDKDEEEVRCRARSACRSSLTKFSRSRWLSAARITAATAGSRRDSGVGVVASGIADNPDETVFVALVRPGRDNEEVEDAAEDENDETEDRFMLEGYGKSGTTKSRPKPALATRM